MEGSNGNELRVIKTLFSADMLVGDTPRGGQLRVEVLVKGPKVLMEG